MSMLGPVPGRSDADDWLRNVEQAEAAALRDQWSRLLASDAFKAEVDAILRQPLAVLIREVLREPQVSAGLRQPLLEGLKTEVLKGEVTTALTHGIRQQVKDAVTAALHDTPVKLGERQLSELRDAATEAAKRAVTDAVRTAARDDAARLVRDVRADLVKDLQASLRRAVSTSEALFPQAVAERILDAVSQYVRDATGHALDAPDTEDADEENLDEPRSASWLLYAGCVGVLLAVIVSSFWFGHWSGAASALPRQNSQAQTPDDPVGESEAIVDSRETPDADAWLPYLQSLEDTGIAISEDTQCASKQLVGVNLADYATVVAELRRCAALLVVPASETSSAVVKVAQQVLVDGHQGSCVAPSLEADGHAGADTTTAFMAHLKCRGLPASPPVTLAHYMALGVLEP